MPSGTIDGRLAAGTLIGVHPGVYALGVAREDALASCLAALLATGPAAVVSHWSAGHLWRLDVQWRPPVHVTVTTGDRRPPGIHVHRSKTFAPRDTRRHHAIKLTSPARTALDLAPALGDRKRTRLVNDLIRRKLLRPVELADVVTRNPLHPGSRLLLPLIDDPAGVTASPLEDLFLEFCRRHDLPTPLLNVVVNGYEVDALFEPERVIVELDSWQFHSDRTAFHSDRTRDNANLVSGHITVRYTHHSLTSDPEHEAGQLRAILDSRRAHGSGRTRRAP